MDSIISSLKSLFSTYGFRAATIVVLSIVIVNLCKRPIVRLGERLAADRGIDKSVVTRHVSCLPFVVAFLLTTIWALCDASFRFTQVDWSGVLSGSLTYGALSIATYETVKKQLEAYAAKKNAAGSAFARDGEKTPEATPDSLPETTEPAQTLDEAETPSGTVEETLAAIAAEATITHPEP